jgi:hypothetical protein
MSRMIASPRDIARKSPRLASLSSPVAPGCAFPRSSAEKNAVGSSNARTLRARRVVNAKRPRCTRAYIPDGEKREVELRGVHL